jgi:DNA-binding NarL/FixJ family response regulator
VRVAIADDSALFREGLRLMLTAAGIEVSAQAATGDELLALIRHDPPDVAVLDIRMPPSFTDEGLATALAIRERHRVTGVLVLSTYAETNYAMRLLADGQQSVGYLVKDRVANVDTLRDALSRIADAGTVIDEDLVRRLFTRGHNVNVLAALTSRERDVLRLMAEGRSNSGIARDLHLSVKSVEGYIATIFRRFDLHGGVDDNRRVLAVLTWLRNGGSPPPGPTRPVA